MADLPAQTGITTTGVESIRALIQSSQVLRDEEREYWYGLLPQMNEAQLTQLKGILEGQNQQKAVIDQKYDQQLQAVGEKTLNRWDGEEARAERVKRVEEEQSHIDEAQSKAEELLSGW